MLRRSTDGSQQGPLISTRDQTIALLTLTLCTHQGSAGEQQDALLFGHRVIQSSHLLHSEQVEVKDLLIAAADGVATSSSAALASRLCFPPPAHSSELIRERSFLVLRLHGSSSPRSSSASLRQFKAVGE